jgi:hypothetical protein
MPAPDNGSPRALERPEPIVIVVTERRSIPLICDMSDAPDTPLERLAEYRSLFETALVGRERTQNGIRFRFRSDAESWVREIAAKEKSCCAFFEFDVSATADEVIWEAGVGDDEMARAVLEEFYRLPELTGLNTPDPET